MCDTSWTVEQAEQRIREEYQLSGGALKDGVKATKLSDNLSSAKSYTFVGGTSTSGKHFH